MTKHRYSREYRLWLRAYELADIPDQCSGNQVGWGNRCKGRVLYALCGPGDNDRCWSVGLYCRWCGGRIIREFREKIAEQWTLVPINHFRTRDKVGHL